MGDERNRGYETVVQGEMMFLYRLTEQTRLTFGFQRAQPRQSFEQEIVHNLNVSVGTIYPF